METEPPSTLVCLTWSKDKHGTLTGRVEPGQNAIEIRDHEIPEPKAGEVLVKFSHSGVCHSDLHLMQHDWEWMNAAVSRPCSLLRKE